MRLTSLALLLTLSAIIGCQRDDPPAAAVYSVPPEVEPYVQRFRDEAQRRGQAIAVTNLVVTLGKTSGADACGQCLLEAGQPPRITLSTDDYCWQKASANERECLVFHELGHCVLGRGHRTERFPNGAFVSLMSGEDVGVYAVCKYPIGPDECNKSPRRDYYVSELFEPATPAPAWGR